VRSLRIAMVAACPFPAAFASSGLIRELSLALIEKGHKVDVIAYHLGNPNFTAPGVNIHRIPSVPGYKKHCSGISLGKPLLDILLARKLLKVCRQEQYDLIHAHNYEAPPAAYFVRKKLKIPVVYHAHNTMLHELPTYFHSTVAQSLTRHIGNMLDHWIPHRADQIITVSDDQTEYLQAIGVPSDQISTVLPAIDSSLFSSGQGSSLRQQLGIGQAPLILYTGGLQPYQNCEILIDVLRYCLKSIPDTHLLILARSTPEWMEDKARSAGVFDRVHFIQGSGIEFEANCLAAADIGVIPRLSCIGFPIKLLNYVAAKLPVVCFEGLNKGFVNQKELLAVPNGDTLKMAREIIRILKNRHSGQVMAENAQKKLNANHSWDKAVSKIESVYSRLLD